MAKKRRVFFWTKVETDMWHDRRIKRLRRADHGAEYILIYLMLTTETANSGFTYVYEGLDDDIETEIALAIDADEDMVKDAIAWYVRLGMAELSEDRQTLTLYADRVGISVGSETNFARDKRDQRDQRKDKREDNVLPGGDNVLPKEDNVLPEGRNCPTEKSKSKSKEVEVKKAPAGKPADTPVPDVPDGVDLDLELPFDDKPATNSAMDASIKAVVEAWNRMVVLVRETEGKNLGTVQSLSPDSDRYIMLYNLLSRGPYMADLMVACIQAIPQVDVWIHPKDPRYEDWKPSFVWLLENWDGKVFRRMEQMGVIKPVMAGGSVTYEVGNTAASGDSAKQKPAFDFGIDFG